MRRYKRADNYENVCILLNKTTNIAFLKNKLIELAPITKVKLYVDITRAHENVYFIEETFAKKTGDNYE